MRITEIRVEKLRKTEQFENDRVGLTVKVDKGEDPAKVFDAASAAVDMLMGGDSVVDHMHEMARLEENAQRFYSGSKLLDGAKVAP